MLRVFLPVNIAHLRRVVVARRELLVVGRHHHHRHDRLLCDSCAGICALPHRENRKHGPGGVPGDALPGRYHNNHIFCYS